MGIKDVIFDLDDTLIVTNREYERINIEVAGYIQKIFPKLSIEEIIATQRSIDLKSVEKYGFLKERFPKSWVDTFLHYHYSNKSVELNTESISEEIFNMVYEIYNVEHEAYYYMYEMLDSVKKLGVNLHLFTAGEEDVQLKKVKKAKLEKYFQSIHVVPYKDKPTMKRVLENRDPSKCIMIGNSLRSDIKPALDNKVRAIFFNSDSWAYDNSIEIDMKSDLLHTISCLSELPVLIKNIKEKHYI